MKNTLKQIESILVVALTIVGIVQGMMLREAGRERHEQQHRIETNEGWHSDTDAWLRHVHGQVDRDFVARGRNEMGAPPARKPQP